MTTAAVALTTQDVDDLLGALNASDSHLIETRKKVGDAWRRDIDAKLERNRVLAQRLIDARRAAATSQSTPF